MGKIFSIRYGRYDLLQSRGPVVVDPTPNPTVRIADSFEESVARELGITRYTMESQLSQGATCFVCMDEDVPVGMLWGHVGPCYIQGAGFPLLLHEREVYMYWGYTRPEARGNKVFSRLRNCFFNFYADHDRFAALVHPKNDVMLAQMSKLGFQRTSRYSYLKSATCSVVGVDAPFNGGVKISIQRGNRLSLPVI